MSTHDNNEISDIVSVTAETAPPMKLGARLLSCRKRPAQMSVGALRSMLPELCYIGDYYHGIPHGDGQLILTGAFLTWKGSFMHGVLPNGSLYDYGRLVFEGKLHNLIPCMGKVYEVTGQTFTGEVQMSLTNPDTLASLFDDDTDKIEQHQIVWLRLHGRGISMNNSLMCETGFFDNGKLVHGINVDIYRDSVRITHFRNGQYHGENYWTNNSDGTFSEGEIEDESPKNEEGHQETTRQDDVPFPPLEQTDQWIRAWHRAEWRYIAECFEESAIGKGKIALLDQSMVAKLRQNIRRRQVHVAPFTTAMLANGEFANYFVWLDDETTDLSDDERTSIWWNGVAFCLTKHYDYLLLPGAQNVDSLVYVDVTHNGIKRYVCRYEQCFFIFTGPIPISTEKAGKLRCDYQGKSVEFEGVCGDCCPVPDDIAMWMPPPKCGDVAKESYILPKE